MKCKNNLTYKEGKMFRKMLASAVVLSMIMTGTAFAGDVAEDYPYSGGIGDSLYYGDLKECSADIFDSDLEFTQDDFADYDLTMVNFWATWCYYCLIEMPELARLQERVPDNVQVLLCCVDYDSEDSIREVLDEADCEGICLYNLHGELAALSNGLEGYPTTLFFDSEGNAVGTGWSGAVPDPCELYTDMMNDILVDMGCDEIQLSEEDED